MVCHICKRDHPVLGQDCAGEPIPGYAELLGNENPGVWTASMKRAAMADAQNIHDLTEAVDSTLLLCDELLKRLPTDNPNRFAIEVCLDNLRKTLAKVERRSC